MNVRVEAQTYNALALGWPDRRLAREGGEAGREQAGLFEWAWTVALREIQI